MKLTSAQRRIVKDLQNGGWIRNIIYQNEHEQQILQEIHLIQPAAYSIRKNTFDILRKSGIIRLVKTTPGRQPGVHWVTEIWKSSK